MEGQQSFTVRLSAAVQNEMSGTSVMQEPNVQWSLDTVKASAARALGDKLRNARSTRKDGSVALTLSFDEATVLYSYMDVWALGALDNISPWAPEYLSQLRSARAMMQKLEGTYGWEVSKW